MNAEQADVLVIGYGNPARQDDGLGPACAAFIAAARVEGVTVDSDYQLVVEDAADAARHQTVIFIDADVAADPPFSFRAVAPDGAIGFSSHSASPEGIMALAKELFHSPVKGYILGIRGYAFEMFEERLTPQAEENKKAAVAFILNVLKTRDFAQQAAPPRDDREEAETCRMEKP